MTLCSALANIPPTTPRRLPELLTFLPVESWEIMYHSDILMMMSEREEGWAGLAKQNRMPEVAGKGLLCCCALEWNQNSICPYIFPPLSMFCRSVVVTPPPRGLSFSLATQLICTNYSLMIEITLNQSIRGE